MADSKHSIQIYAAVAQAAKKITLASTKLAWMMKKVKILSSAKNDSAEDVQAIFVENGRLIDAADLEDEFNQAEIDPEQSADDEIAATILLIEAHRNQAILTFDNANAGARSAALRRQNAADEEQVCQRAILKQRLEISARVHRLVQAEDRRLSKKDKFRAKVTAFMKLLQDNFSSDFLLPFQADLAAGRIRRVWMKINAHFVLNKLETIVAVRPKTCPNSYIYF